MDIPTPGGVPGQDDSRYQLNSLGMWRMKKKKEERGVPVMMTVPGASVVP
jgi:hypothetical protein